MAGNWDRVRGEILSGAYVPSPVLRAEIPKARGGMRQLGIPTVVDRLIQQMILQVLGPRIDPTFSEWSYGRLRLEVNEQKSAVAPAHSRKFLGYDFWYARSGEVRRGVAEKTLATFKSKVRELTRRKRGVSFVRIVGELSVFVRGWKAYFQLAQTPRVFRDFDKWIRHRLRVYQLSQWKRGRAILRELLPIGVPTEIARSAARNQNGLRRNSAPSLNAALTLRYFDQLGLPRLAD